MEKLFRFFFKKLMNIFENTYFHIKHYFSNKFSKTSCVTGFIKYPFIPADKHI